MNSNQINIAINGFNVRFENGYLFSENLTWESQTGLNLITGNNGSGKTLLLKSLSILSPTIFDSFSISGNLLLKGISHIDRSDKYNSKIISYLPQANDIINIGSTVDNELCILSNRIKIDFDRYIKALEILKFKFGYSELKSRPTVTFSRGEKQKLALAFLEAINPQCIFYDEPDSFLDSTGQKGLINLIKSQLSENKIIFIASHNKTLYKDINHKELKLVNSDYSDYREHILPTNINSSKILTINEQKIQISKRNSFIISAFEINQGEIIKIIGKNGSGKSTLLNRIFHNKLSCVRLLKQKEITYITDEPDNQILYQSLEFEINSFKKGNHYFDNELIKQSLQIFENKKLNIHTLSWGQRKYLLLLLAIASDSKLLLLDEPFTGINGYLRESLLKLMIFAIEHGKSILLTLNDSEILQEIQIEKRILI